MTHSDGDALDAAICGVLQQARADVPHSWRLDGNAHDTAVMSANFYHFAQRLLKD